MTPTVSVTMPVYNAERYVEEAARSILAQTFDDLELLVIDDGSTDGSRAILERIAAGDPRVRLVSRPNAGIGATRNELLGMARGDLLAVMDADDVARPDRLARQVQFLREHPEVVAVGGAHEHIDSKGRSLYVQREPEGHDEIQDMALGGRCPICHPSAMIRRDALLAVGGYRAEMQPAEDMDLWLRLGERGRLANLPDVLVRYRVHEGSASGSQQARQIGLMRLAIDQACDRRGLPRRELDLRPWRPVDRASRQHLAACLGWAGFHRGDRPMALHYGLKAVGLMPWRQDGWRLLACALLKIKPKPAGGRG